MPVSQNGYEANDESRTQSWKIPGTARAVRLRKGSPGNLLVLFAAWFDKAVEDIDAGQPDDWGYAERPIRGSTTTLSNHASGTALDLNATRHPLGKRGTFTAAQTAKIRAELKRYGGCIRWGGDYSGRPDEMHFEIVRDVATCNKVLASLTQPQQEDDEDMPTIKEVEDAAYRADVRYGHALFSPTGTGTAIWKSIRANGNAIAALAAAIKVEDTGDDAALKAAVSQLQSTHADLEKAVQALADGADA